MFDEWQVEPAIWNKVRRQVDDRDGKGLFILTGSATPSDDADRHSGAGRFSVMSMRPMSLFESGHSNGEISLAKLLDGEPQTGLGTHLTFSELLDRIVIGGWPELIDADEMSARRWLRDYLTNIVEVDIRRLGSRRDPDNLRRLLESLGRSVGQATKAAELAKVSHQARAQLAVTEHLLAERMGARLAAVRLDPPDYLTKALGQRPTDPRERGAWDRGALHIERFRAECGITDKQHALGREPSRSAARTRTPAERSAEIARREAERRLRHHQRQLAQVKAKARERSLGLGRSIGR